MNRGGTSNEWGEESHESRSNHSLDYGFTLWFCCIYILNIIKILYDDLKCHRLFPYVDLKYHGLFPYVDLKYHGLFSYVDLKYHRLFPYVDLKCHGLFPYKEVETSSWQVKLNESGNDITVNNHCYILIVCMWHCHDNHMMP